MRHKGNGKKLAAVVLSALMLVSVGCPADAKDTQNATQNTAVMCSDICEGENGMLYMTDADSNAVWKYSVKKDKTSILAGKVNGGSNAKLQGAWGIEKYKGGYVIADTEKHVLRMLKNGKLTTFAGTTTGKLAEGAKKKVRFNRPTGLAVGDNGELYVADTGNNRICVINKKGNVKTYVGGKKGCTDGKCKSARLYEPTALFYQKGVLYIADSGNHRVCKVEKGKLTTIAGSASGVEGSKNGKAKGSLLSYPQGIVVSKGVVYIADTGNSCVRKLAKGKVTTLISAYSMQDEMLPSAPRALYIEGKYLYIGDINVGQLIRKKL